MNKILADPRIGFLKLFDLANSRVLLEPKLVFLCGGKVDVKTTENHSVRNMFMNLSAMSKQDDLNEVVLAENFKDWKDGYFSLSEFENDIAYLSSFVVIILESEGALTEFGMFFANEKIRKKLIVVLHEEFYHQESFIKFGLLNPLQEMDEEHVKAYQIDHRKIGEISKDEVNDIVLDISKQCRNSDKSEKFDSLNRGHHIFLIFQIIDLFLVLTSSEIEQYIVHLGIVVKKKNIKSALYILEKFHLIGSARKSAQTFYYPRDGRNSRVDLRLSEGTKRFDKYSIQIQVRDFYSQNAKNDSNFKRRLKVIEGSHEKVISDV